MSPVCRVFGLAAAVWAFSRDPGDGQTNGVLPGGPADDSEPIRVGVARNGKGGHNGERLEFRRGNSMNSLEPEVILYQIYEEGADFASRCAFKWKG